LVSAVDEMMNALRRKYNEMDRELVMPFINLCAQILDGRPICYSGGGSIFRELQLPIKSNGNGIGYNFSSVTSVSQLVDHSKLYVNNEIFHVLATAFALSKRSLGNDATNEERDGIKLVSLDRLFGGIHNPIEVGPITPRGRRRWSTL
jgi:hypothetical protein